MRALRSIKYQIYGVVFLAVLAVVVTLVGAVYNGAFDRAVPVTLVAGRAGLLMSPGADVKLHGVPVGKVTEVAVDGHRARITLGLAPETIERIPGNVRARLLPTTVLGPKFVSLASPEKPAAKHIRAGDIIRGSDVTVEIQRVLENAVALVDSIDPAKLNVTLGALATALEGRGDQLGDLLVQSAEYLRRFNRSLPTLQQGLSALPEVVDTYADVSSNLLTVLANLTHTSNTVLKKQDDLDGLLEKSTRLSEVGRRFLRDNGDALDRALALLEPTTGLLERYSPMFPCFFKGLSRVDKLYEDGIGGEVPGVNQYATVPYGQKAYTYSEDLPEVAADSGPDCHGLPVIEPDETPVPFADFDDGAMKNPPTNEPPELSKKPLAILLFGTSAWAEEVGAP